ncbi:UNVERIFIED_CONTAM: hypothetical protein FKN15_046748 [Acipenser sinensis]
MFLFSVSSKQNCDLNSVATDEEYEYDMALQIHFTLIQVFCFDKRLAEILVNTDESGKPKDVHCILITSVDYPVEESDEESGSRWNRRAEEPCDADGRFIPRCPHFPDGVEAGIPEKSVLEFEVCVKTFQRYKRKRGLWEKPP